MARPPTPAAGASVPHEGPAAHATPTAPGLRAHTPLIGPPLAPPLYLPSGPFCGFPHLSYKHYLAAEHDCNAPEQVGPMPPLDAFALISE